MKFYKIILLCSFTLLVTACATNQTIKSESVKEEPLPKNTISYLMSYGLYTFDYQKWAGFRKNKDITFYFPTVNGSVFGATSRDFLQIITVPPAEKFTLLLPATLSDRAPVFKQKNLTIEPLNTQVMRLGTFHTYDDYQGKLGGGGFGHKKTGESMMLLYFSKTAKMTGLTVAGGEEYDFNIQAKKPGWLWVKSTKVAPKKFKVERYDGNLNSLEFRAFISKQALQKNQSRTASLY